MGAGMAPGIQLSSCGRQHGMVRGSPSSVLLLPALLAQVMRGLWPDTGSEYEGPESGNVIDAIEFLLLNFTEMNKLW